MRASWSCRRIWKDLWSSYLSKMSLHNWRVPFKTSMQQVQCGHFKANDHYQIRAVSIFSFGETGQKIISDLQLCFQKILLLTDSSIFLFQLYTLPHKLKTFVANRVTKIQSFLIITIGIIYAQKTPPDIVSRDANAKELMDNDLWWFGKDLLQQEIIAPSQFLTPTDSGSEQDLKNDFTFTHNHQ